MVLCRGQSCDFLDRWSSPLCTFTSSSRNGHGDIYQVRRKDNPIGHTNRANTAETHTPQGLSHRAPQSVPFQGHERPSTNITPPAYPHDRTLRGGEGEITTGVLPRQPFSRACRDDCSAEHGKSCQRTCIACGKGILARRESPARRQTSGQKSGRWESAAATLCFTCSKSLSTDRASRR